MPENLTAPQVEQQFAQMLETVLIKGDLKSLSAKDRMQYYNRLCDSVGLNPLTRPFEYIEFQGKLTLYARKDATDQLRKLHNVSIKIVSREKIGDVFVVTAQASLPSGRVDESIGAVALGTLKGDALANSYMKTETKSKRRATLSICGLGMLDETEVETIPGAKVPVDAESHPPKPELAKPQVVNTDMGPPSPKQLDALFEASSIANWTPEECKAFIKERFKKSGTSELTWRECLQMTDYVAKHAKPADFVDEGPFPFEGEET